VLLNITYSTIFNDLAVCSSKGNQKIHPNSQSRNVLSSHQIADCCDHAVHAPFAGVCRRCGHYILKRYNPLQYMHSRHQGSAFGIVTPDNGAAFRKQILSRGSSRDPMVSYKAFRGIEPTVDALLIRRGLK